MPVVGLVAEQRIGDGDEDEGGVGGHCQQRPAAASQRAQARAASMNGSRQGYRGDGDVGKRDVDRCGAETERQRRLVRRVQEQAGNGGCEDCGRRQGEGADAVEHGELTR